MPPPSTAVAFTPERAAHAHVRTGVLAVGMLSLGHFTVDLYGSAIGAFQPLLVDKLHLTLAQAGILGGLLVFSSSVMQPVYGLLSDRYPTRLFTVLAPAMAGIFIAGLGIAGTFPMAIALVLLGGAGIASFHPQASAWATRGVTENRGRWMAVFISAGTLGMALGPTFFSLVISRFGFHRTPWTMAAGIGASLLLMAWLPAFPAASGEAAAAGRRDRAWSALAQVWKPLTILYLLVFIRSILQITYAQFLPLYLHRERGFALPEASYALSLYLTAGAVGGFLGGRLSDVWGGKRVILISMLSSVPCLALFFFTSGWLSMLGLALGGLTLLFTIPVNVVMAQELVPSASGTVSALMMGFAWGMAGLVFIPITGKLSDLFSMHQVLSSLIVFPLIGVLLTLKLKDRPRR